MNIDIMRIDMTPIYKVYSTSPTSADSGGQQDSPGYSNQRQTKQALGNRPCLENTSDIGSHIDLFV